MSKDPSTQVGAVIFRPDMTIASMGRNGFEQGANDDPALYLDRSYKLCHVIHAEHNAIRFGRESMQGYGLCVWPLPPCQQCMERIAAAGIAVVVAPIVHESNRWYASGLLAKKHALSLGIEYREYYL